MRHGITLGLDGRRGRSADIVADERKVKQVLLNLLSNAVKFTPDGGRVRSRRSAHNRVEISVTDTGIGISFEDQEAVFEEFRQVGTDAARSRKARAWVSRWQSVSSSYTAARSVWKARQERGPRLRSRCRIAHPLQAEPRRAYWPLLLIAASEDEAIRRVMADLGS